MQQKPPVLAVAQIVPVTEAEGPGRRFALWLQGCPLRCPGCCNPEMLPFSGGQPTSVQEVFQQVCIAQEKDQIEGITLLGGEPFAHAWPASQLAQQVQQQGLSVMVFSGFTLEQIQSQSQADPHVQRLLKHIDILVDGPYIREQPETSRRWIGSSNQRIHFLTDRCPTHDWADDPRWRMPNTLEIRMADGEISVNGFPAPRAVGLWRRPARRNQFG